jgi:hypothetical protein
MIRLLKTFSSRYRIYENQSADILIDRENHRLAMIFKADDSGAYQLTGHDDNSGLKINCGASTIKKFKSEYGLPETITDQRFVVSEESDPSLGTIYTIDYLDGIKKTYEKGKEPLKHGKL